MATSQTQPVRKPSRGFFIFNLSFFLASAAVFLLFMKLDRTIEKTAGKVIETYTKKTIASRKQTYDQEYFVVNFTANGKDYTTKTPHRSGYGQEYVTVYYYKAFPGFAWCYNKANANIVYCCIAMFLSVIMLGMAWSSMTKAKRTAQASEKKKKS